MTRVSIPQVSTAVVSDAVGGAKPNIHLFKKLINCDVFIVQFMIGFPGLLVSYMTTLAVAACLS